jgi:hypothetical protein
MCSSLQCLQHVRSLPLPFFLHSLSSLRFLTRLPLNRFVQVSAIIGANLYQASDSPPYYPKANTGILAVIAFNLVIVYVRFYFPLLPPSSLPLTLLRSSTARYLPLLQEAQRVQGEEVERVYQGGAG